MLTEQQIAAMRMAQELRALADKFSEGWHTGIKIDASDIMLLTDVAAALEQPAQQEPVAWANPNDLQNFDMKVRTNGGPLHTVPLYTHPAREPVIDKSAAKRIATALGWEPKRQPLTDEQISKIDWKQNETLHDFARAIERAHGIKGDA